jgi:putative ABC transport system substrate-binding protein
MTVAVRVRGADEFDAAFATMVNERADAVVVQGLIGQNPFAREGGLMSYSLRQSDLFRRAAYYVDRILKGARPADLPVEQPTKYELVINLKTASTLGLTRHPLGC